MVLMVSPERINYIDVAPSQMVGVSAGLIPFLEHDDANRALMGSNMQRQAVPLLLAEPPLVATGMERDVALNSSMVVRAKRAGKVTQVDADHVTVNNDEYPLKKFVGLNERTCLNQKPLVMPGQKVERGEMIADGASTYVGELALGRNVVGPRDGLYIIDDGGTYRVYIQEKGEDYYRVSGATFEEARDAAIHRLIQLQGLPYTPPGN